MKARIVGAVLIAVCALVLPARASDRSTIYETLAAEENNTVLAVAVKEAGVAAALKGKDDYTLFAPTDAAFRKLGDEAIGLIANSKEAVQQLCRAHLVKGRYTTAALKKMNGQSLATVSGGTLKIEDRKDGVYVGGVKIAAELECKNGVIHVLEAVLATPKG